MGSDREYGLEHVDPDSAASRRTFTIGALRKQKNRCYLCDRHVVIVKGTRGHLPDHAATIDHIVPLSGGGGLGQVPRRDDATRPAHSGIQLPDEDGDMTGPEQQFPDSDVDRALLDAGFDQRIAADGTAWITGPDGISRNADVVDAFDEHDARNWDTQETLETATDGTRWVTGDDGISRNAIVSQHCAECERLAMQFEVLTSANRIAYEERERLRAALLQVRPYLRGTNTGRRALVWVDAALNPDQEPTDA